MQKFDIKEICKKTPKKLTWERFEYTRKNPLKSGAVIGNQGLHLRKCCFKNNIGIPEDEGIKVKEESTIGI
eukprot:8221045-Ditylum_brightwellii.AAC.1